MTIAIGADHAGYDLKAKLCPRLESKGHRLIDVGAYSSEPSDYPDIAAAVGKAIQDGTQRGVLICGSGVGASIAANKLRGVRAAICHDSFLARQGVEDDDMNVLVLGARVVAFEFAEILIDDFLSARFSKAERHARRLAKVIQLESRGIGFH